MKMRRVLIIDGDPMDPERHCRVLSEARYTVFTARNCHEAAGILKKHHGKMVVLSELAVGGKCMVAFMKEKRKEYPFLPFLFLVSSPSMESAVETLKAGAADYLRKPVSKDILCRSVAESTARMDVLLESGKLEKEFRKRFSRSQEDLQSAKTISSFKGFMISMAAHDFRTLLTVLDGYLEFLREKCRGCPVSTEEGMMHRANRTVTRLLSMANTLLDFEAAETGRIRTEIRPFDLGETLRDCAGFYMPYAETKRVNLVFEPQCEGVVIKGDREKVMEILDNLLYNALKFTPSKGSIHLSGKQEKGYATISVSDSGSGIPEDKLRNLFNPENMVATLDSHARLGLGMMICKRLVEAQNGEIEVSSVLGKGTTVLLRLPSE